MREGICAANEDLNMHSNEKLSIINQLVTWLRESKSEKLVFGR